MKTKYSLLGLSALTSTALIFALSAFAQSVTNTETGVTISPPAGYVATISTMHFSRSENRAVQATVRHESLSSKCTISIVRATPDESRRTQADRDLAVQTMIRRRPQLQREFKIVNDDFEHLGAKATMLFAPKTGIEPRSAFNELQIWIYPPPGIIIATCTAEGIAFEKRRTEFEAIVRGISFEH